MFLTKEAVRLAVPGHAEGVACDGCPPLPRLFEQFAQGAARRARRVKMLVAAARNEHAFDDGTRLARASGDAALVMAAAGRRVPEPNGKREVRTGQSRCGADGTFLDVGCANGYLMECIVRWTRHRVEPYGLELAGTVAELARQQRPHWAQRIFVGNAS